jgi:hypothetical protein
MRLAFVWASGFTLVAAVGCSTAATPSLDPSKRLNALSTSELAQLCDWTANQQGGYGSALTCEAAPYSPLHAATSQNECVVGFAPHASMPSCSITVGEWMMCADWTVSTWCTFPHPPAPASCEEFQAGCYGDEVAVFPEAGTD